jgi:hypothetical protein
MTDTPVIRIDTLEDLKKALFLQKQMTRRAHDELQTVAGDSVLEGNPNPDPETIKKFMKDEANLLKTYAFRLTLTEWAMGGVTAGNTAQWGATFGVALIVGELILAQVNSMHPGYGAAIKGFFVNLLALENRLRLNGDDTSEIDGLVMNFNVTKKDGTPVDDEATKTKIRKGLHEVLHTILAAGIEYGLFEETETGHQITKTGHRVMLHMHDVQTFVETLAAAHARFQNEVPALMSTMAEVVEKAKVRRKRAKKQLPPSS